jgi:FOG: CheY-like receiver
MDPMSLRTHSHRDFGDRLARISIGLSPQTTSPSPRFSVLTPHPSIYDFIGDPRILAVEDNSETQLLLEHLLKGSYETEVVAGVEAALAAVEETPFEVLLLDINLSEDQTGTDLLHLIRERDGMGQVPAIALTAYAMPGDREDFLEKGFDEYVSKPFTRDDLTEAIESTLNPA